MRKFIAIVLTAFLARVKPVSSIAKPSCMNITRKPVISTQARLSEFVRLSISRARAIPLSARADDGKESRRTHVANAAPAASGPDRRIASLGRGIILPPHDRNDAAASAPRGSDWRARSAGQTDQLAT